MYGEWGREQAYTSFWFENLKERTQLLAQGVDGRMIIRWIFRKWDVGVMIGRIRLRIGRVGGHLYMCL